MSKITRHIQRLVVKVGSSVLTHGTGRPNQARLHQLVDQIAECANQHREIVLVSSGAIASGMARLGLKRRPKAIGELQACAAIGQGELMHRYSEAFGARDLAVAQVLLTQADLADRRRYRNARTTLQTLLSKRVVPIVNENDTVAVEEITFGDNDRLAALVACLVDAELLVILSDVDGLLRNGKVVRQIERLDHSHQQIALGPSKETTTGGMAAKLAAARIVWHAGIPMVIANGGRSMVLRDILDGKPVGTLIAPPKSRLAFHKWWIAFSARKPAGTIVIDSGAADALLSKGRSLLASGIAGVHGRFHAGEAVTILDQSEREIARGLSHFSSHELTRIRGLRSDQIVELLGSGAAKEVVHRDNLVLTKDLS